MFKKGHKIAQVFISRFFFFLVYCLNDLYEPSAYPQECIVSNIISSQAEHFFSFPEMTSAISTLSEMTTARIHRKGAGNISPE